MPAPKKKKAPTGTKRAPQRMPKTAPELEVALYADRSPWEYHPWETGQSYHAFCVYLRLGPQRSLARTSFELMPEEKKAQIIASGQLPTGQDDEQDESNEQAKKNTDQSLLDDPLVAALTDQLAPVEPTPVKGKGGRPAAITRTLALAPASGAAGNITGWASKYMWKERAVAWDAHLEELDRQNLIDARADLSRRAQESGRFLGNIATYFMKRYMDEGDAMKIKPPSWDQIVKMLEAGNKLEKSGLGLDDETAQKINLQLTQTINTEGLSDAELDQLIELQSKVVQQGGKSITTAYLPPEPSGYKPPSARIVSQSITVDTATASRVVAAPSKTAKPATPDSLSDFFGLG